MTVKRSYSNTDKFTIYPHGYIFGDGSDMPEKVTVCLPRPFLRMLQSQSARYLWYNSYRLNGERIELSDAEKKLLLEGNYNLLFGAADGCQIDVPVLPPDEEIECEIVNYYRTKGRCVMCFCGNNCGCGQGEYCQPPDQPNPDEQPFPPPVSNEPGDNEEDAVWCRRFSWFVAAWVGTLGAIDGGAGSGIELSVAWLSALITSKLGQLGLVLAGILATISSWLISSTAWRGMYDAVNDPDVLTALVCAIYTADTPLEAKEEFKDIVSQTNHTWYQGLLLNLWRGVIDWNAMFSETVWTALEATFPVILSTPLNCMCDGSAPPVPPGEGEEEPVNVGEPDNWYLVPTVMINAEAQDNASLVNGGFQHFYNASHPSKDETNALAQLDSPYLDVDLLTASGLIGDVNHFGGFVFQRISTDNVRLGHFSNVGMVRLEPNDLEAFELVYWQQSGSDLASADVLVFLASQFPTANINHKGNKDFGDAGRDTIRYRMNTGGEAGHIQIIWALIEATHVILP